MKPWQRLDRGQRPRDEFAGDDRFFAQRINDLGVSKDHILVATMTRQCDMRVEIIMSLMKPIPTNAATGPRTSISPAITTHPRISAARCSRISRQVADPRDLIQPRDMDASNSARRTTVINNYEQGKTTSSDKRSADLSNEQSGTSRM